MNKNGCLLGIPNYFYLQTFLSQIYRDSFSHANYCIILFIYLLEFNYTLGTTCYLHLQVGTYFLAN